MGEAPIGLGHIGAEREWLWMGEVPIGLGHIGAEREWLWMGEVPIAPRHIGTGGPGHPRALTSLAFPWQLIASG